MTCLAWRGSALATGGRDGALLLWDGNLGGSARPMRAIGAAHQGHVTAIHAADAGEGNSVVLSGGQVSLSLSRTHTPLHT